jgi:hypothetical protein
MPGPTDQGALWRIVGERRPPQVGIDPDTFRSERVLEPAEAELDPYSTNPRNRYGDWYEATVGETLRDLTRRLGLTITKHVKLDYRSPVYAGDRVVDGLVCSEDGLSLGLELKYLHGNGSLVKPKTLVDAIDFTHRPVDCIYVIDGPGWLETKNVEYLATWWRFTCLSALERTLGHYFPNSGRSVRDKPLKPGSSATVTLMATRPEARSDEGNMGSR